MQAANVPKEWPDLQQNLYADEAKDNSSMLLRRRYERLKPRRQSEG